MTKNSDQMTLHCPLPYKTYISHTYLYFWSSICARKASLAAATLVFLASRPILAAYLFLVTFFSVLALGDGSEQMAASANLDVDGLCFTMSTFFNSQEWIEYYRESILDQNVTST